MLIKKLAYGGMFLMKKDANRRRIKVAPVILTVCLVLTCFCCARQGMVLWELKERQAGYDAEYAELQQENAELLETMALLDDEAYMERLARERFKLIKPGEYLVVPAETDETIDDYVKVDESDLH